MVHYLLNRAAATGAASTWKGGPGVFRVGGTFGGATVTLQFQAPDDSTWVAAGTDTTLTAAGGGVFNLDKCQIRALVAGGAPSNLVATVEALGA